MTHVRTCESVQLPPSDPPWQLAHDTQGRAYLHSGVAVEWAAAHFRHPVYFNGKCGQVLILRGNAGTLLTDWQGKVIADVCVSVQAPPHGEVSIPVTCSLAGRQGIHICLIFILCIMPWGCKPRRGWHGGGQMQAGRGGSHIQVALGRDAYVCRQKLQARKICRILARLFFSKDGRTLDCKALSTHAFVILLCRWSSAPKHFGGMQHPSGRASCEGLLASFVQAALGSGCASGTCFMDTGASWEPPGWPSGGSAIELDIQCGTLGLTPLSSTVCPRSSAVLEKMGLEGCLQEGCRVEVGSCFRALLSDVVPAALMSFTRQLPAFLGIHADMHCKEVALSLKPQDMKSMTNLKQAKSLARYVLATGQTCA